MLPESPTIASTGVTRRLLLLGSATAAAALMPRRAPAQDPSGPASTSTALAVFAATLAPLARQVQAGDARSEDAYLFTAAREALRLLDLPSGEFTPFPNLPSTSTAPLLREAPLTVMLVRVAKGAHIPLHDHGGTLGLILGLQGELRVRNFVLANGDAHAPADGTFRLRQTTDDLILPGRVSTLGSVRDNFHDVTAGPEGALMLDLFTVVQRGVRSRFHRLDTEPVDGPRREWTARPGTLTDGVVR